MASPRSDPRCPTCDGKVSATATWCMHCGRDLPDRADFDDVSADDEGGGESLLTRMRPGSAADERDRARAHESDRSAAAERDRYAAGDARSTAGVRATTRGEGDPADPSSVAREWLRPDALAANPSPFAAAAAAVVAAAVLGPALLGLSLAATGAGLAVVACLASIAVVARRRSGFDAMRYGVWEVSILLIFVPFALAAGADGSAGGDLVAFLLALVPIAVAALFAAGLGTSTDDFAAG